jgi:hypothetical protein
MARADRIERPDAWPTGGCLRFFREYEFVGSFKLATVALRERLYRDQAMRTGRLEQRVDGSVVIPAQAGIQRIVNNLIHAPFAGMTGHCVG